MGLLSDGITHNHSEGRPCNSECMTVREFKAYQRRWDEAHGWTFWRRLGRFFGICT